jgi:MFS family permease
MDVALRSAVARRRVAMTAATVGTLVSAFEGTVVTSAMPTIARELGGMGAYAWVFSAFLITSTLAMLVCGKLADAYGRLPVFVGGMALFLFGSVLCGAATSFGALVFFRAIQGLGAGSVQPLSLTIGADLYRLNERARVQAFTTAAWGMANILGPIIGGLIVEHASWRWVFLVNVPVGVVAVGLLLVSYRDPPRTARGPMGAWGALLAGTATALVSFALSPNGLHARTSRIALSLTAVGAVALLVRHQLRTKAPLLPATVVSEPAVRTGLASNAFIGGILYACAAYVPLWITAQGRGNAVTAGVTLVPLLTGWALGSYFSVRVLVEHGMRPVQMGAFALAFAGSVCLAVVVAFGLPTPWAFAAVGLLGFGLGPAASSSVLAPQSCVAWKHRGVVTSAVFAVRMLGGSIAVAALGALGRGGHEGARFVGIAALALGGFVTAGALAPRATLIGGRESVTPAA